MSNYSCRHCYGRHEFPQPATSYVEQMVYGRGATMEQVLEWVESKSTGNPPHVAAVSMPGITIWCHACRRMSVVSYTYYRWLSMERDCIPESKILSQSVYYTRMCMGAEMWLGLRDMAA